MEFYILKFWFLLHVYTLRKFRFQFLTQSLLWYQRSKFASGRLHPVRAEIGCDVIEGTNACEMPYHCCESSFRIYPNCCNSAWLQDAAILKRIVSACFTFQLTTRFGRNGQLKSNEREIAGRVQVHTLSYVVFISSRSVLKQRDGSSRSLW